MTDGRKQQLTQQCEPSAQQLLDYIFDPEEDDINGSIRFGLIFEMLADLRHKQTPRTTGLVAVNRSLGECDGP